MPNKTQNTQIALLGTSDVPKMLAQVTAQISLIKGTLPETPKTKADIPGFGKIDDLIDLATIIKAASAVLGKAKAYRDTAEIIMPEHLKTPVFRLNGMNEEEMLEHLKTRAVEVGNKEKLDKLKKIKFTLEANLSQKEKLANDLKKIQNLLADEEDE